MINKSQRLVSVNEAWTVPVSPQPSRWKGIFQHEHTMQKNSCYDRIQDWNQSEGSEKA